MAVQKGRDMLLKISDGAAFVTVAGLRARTVSLNAKTVDVTDSGSGGWRELLAGPGCARCRFQALASFGMQRPMR